MKEAVPADDAPAKTGWKKRRKKFVKPEIQWSWISMTLLTVAVSAIAQAMIVVYLLSRLATQIPNDGESVLTLMPQYIVLSLGLTVLFLTPLLVLVSVLVSFRIAGPLYRLETYLGQVAAGERPPDCRLRKGDKLQELCRLVNEATAPLRRHDQAEALDEPRREAA
jgi:hypothetical protein